MSKGKVYKVIVIGDSNVGKTCLTYRFCEGKFPQTPSVTIGMDFRQRKLEINGETLILQLWDTAGLERNRRSMVKHYYRNVQAVILVYDVTNLKSFESLNHWIEECNKHTFDDDVLKIMVGNKCDEGSIVSTHTAQRFADSHNMPLFETSAKLDSEYDNVEGIFVTLAHKLANSQPLMKTETVTLPQSVNSTDTSAGSNCCYFF